MSGSGGGTPIQAPASVQPTPILTPAAAASTTGRFNARHNRRRNENQDNGNNTSNKFVPKLTFIESLVSSSENKGQDFTKFQKSIHHHALTTFKNSKDISKDILEFVNPYVELSKHKPNLTVIRSDNGLHPELPVSGEDDSVKFSRESDNADKKEMAKLLYSSQVKLNADQERDLTQNLTILWATIIGQCSPALQEEVKGHPDYLPKSADFNSIWLLETLQKITARANKTTNKYFSAFKATKKFYLTQQGQTENVDEYYSRFDNARDLVQLFNAEIVDVDKLFEAEKTYDTSITKDMVLQKYTAVALVMNANKNKYESLWNKLENDLLVGQDSYPTTIGGATHLLTNWKANTPTNNRGGQGGGGSNGGSGGVLGGGNRNGGSGGPAVSFVQAQVPMPANKDFSKLDGYDPARPDCAPSRKHPHHISDHITCTRCQIKGHYATACPFIINAAPQLFQLNRIAVQLSQAPSPQLLEPQCIIVDSGSTFNCFREA